MLLQELTFLMLNKYFLANFVISLDYTYGTYFFFITGSLLHLFAIKSVSSMLVITTYNHTNAKRTSLSAFLNLNHCSIIWTL